MQKKRIKGFRSIQKMFFLSSALNSEIIMRRRSNNSCVEWCGAFLRSHPSECTFPVVIIILFTGMQNFGRSRKSHLTAVIAIAQREREQRKILAAVTGGIVKKRRRSSSALGLPYSAIGSRSCISFYSQPPLRSLFFN
jgi:hypothetical protein